MTFALAFGIRYVAYDGPTAAHGYRFAPAADAITFKTKADAVYFTTISGPGWLLDMIAKGLVVVVPLDQEGFSHA